MADNRNSTSHHLSILDMPPEILDKIFKFFPTQFVPVINLVCKYFKEACSTDAFWQNRCEQDFNVVYRGSVGEPSAYNIYVKLLHRYKFLLGIFTPVMDHYGGIYQGKFENNMIVCNELHSQAFGGLHKPLTNIKAFTVRLSNEIQIEMLCHRGWFGSHNCTISKEPNGINFRCLSVEYHNYPAGVNVEFQNWVKLELDGDPSVFWNIAELHKRMKAFKQYELECVYKPLQTPKKQDGLVMQPGLFKADYQGTHGTELIMLDYNEDKTEAFGLKITGDPNVPAGALTMKADLLRPMVLTLDQQDLTSTLTSIDTPYIPPEDVHKIKTQPFKLPSDMYMYFDRAVGEFPKFCRWRFYGKGQIANTGYKDSQFVNGHWVIFNEDCFGFFWLDLKFFNIFFRVNPSPI